MMLNSVKFLRCGCWLWREKEFSWMCVAVWWIFFRSSCSWTMWISLDFAISEKERELERATKWGYLKFWTTGENGVALTDLKARLSESLQFILRTEIKCRGTKIWGTLLCTGMTLRDRIKRFALRLYWFSDTCHQTGQGSKILLQECSCGKGHRSAGRKVEASVSKRMQQLRSEVLHEKRDEKLPRGDVKKLVLEERERTVWRKFLDSPQWQGW